MASGAGPWAELMPWLRAQLRTRYRRTRRTAAGYIAHRAVAGSAAALRCEVSGSTIAR